MRACWIGKNIGGTMGGPYEHHIKILGVQGFSTPPNVVLPNDDLNLHLIWLYAMERFGFQNINANLLAELWTSCTTPYRNKYGIRRCTRPSFFSAAKRESPQGIPYLAAKFYAKA